MHDSIRGIPIHITVILHYIRKDKLPFGDRLQAFDEIGIHVFNIKDLCIKGEYLIRCRRPHAGIRVELSKSDLG